MSTLQNITTGYFRAEDKLLVFTIVDAANATMVITGWTIAFRLGPNKGTTPIITKTAAILNQTTNRGQCTITLASADTAALSTASDTTFYYDLRRTDTGARAELVYGTITLLQTFTDG